MKSKFLFISEDFELPLLDHNREWLTNVWVYCIVGLLGAFSGLLAIPAYFTGANMSQAAGVTGTIGLFVVLSAWCGCTATAFAAIPKTRYAVIRSVFNLVVLALVFAVCAALSIIAVVFLILMFASFAMSSGGRSQKSSSSSGTPDEVYDENGNVHYVSGSNGSDRVHTTDGLNLRRGADGTYREY